jgi:hypothetical protein
MPLDFPNIVPENNLRLPDALTIKHGPAPLLSKFVLQGDRTVREMGIRLRLRHDFDELVHINKQETARGTWFPLINMFHPDYTDLRPENSFWLSGEDENGNVVLTWAARVYYWPNSSLADNAGLFLCDKIDRPYPHRASPEATLAMRSIDGIVFWGGSLWIHPDFRHNRLSPIVGRLGRAFAVSRWPVDWIMCFVQPAIVQSGVAAGYGYRHMSRGIVFPGSCYGDLEVFLVYLSVAEAYEDFDEFLALELSGSDHNDDAATLLGTRRLHTVTRTSSDDVAQGRVSRS